MGMEQVVSRLSGGQNLDMGNSSFSGARKRSNIDELQGSLGGLSRHATAYLFWTYLDLNNERPLEMKAILNYQASAFLDAEHKKIDPLTQVRIVKAAMASLKTATFKPCMKCDSTGIVNGINCERCHGTGKVSSSKRQLSRDMGLSWSTFSSNSLYERAYSHLLGFCSVLEKECRNHFRDDDHV